MGLPAVQLQLLQRNFDPTHTVTLRRDFARQMRIRFRKIRGAIRTAIVDRDVFGLQETNPVMALTDPRLPGPRQFDFPRSGEKIEAFMDWLRRETDNVILDIPQLGRGIEDRWTDTYIQSAYQQGIRRGRQELIGADYQVPSIEETGGIEVWFNQPFHADRVGLLYTRTFNDLRGITSAMDGQISRILAQGMADGKHPRQLAKMLTRTIKGPQGDLALTDTLGRFIPAERRAEVLARTEMIRAHAEAQIQEFRNWRAEGVKIKAEWTTAQDGRVCEECASREGRTYTLEEASGMIPLHPQCRCVFIPLDKEEVN